MPPAVIIPTAELQDLKGGNKTYALIAILGKEFDRQSRYVPIQTYLFDRQICVYRNAYIYGFCEADATWRLVFELPAGAAGLAHVIGAVIAISINSGGSLANHEGKGIGALVVNS